MVLARCQLSGVATFRAEQFSVSVSDEVLADLRARIRNTRWPGAPPGAQWEQGTDLGYLRGLLEYWADGFDWRAQERWLNGFRQFRAGIDGIRVHFVHERARSGRGIPLILTNGWPGRLRRVPAARAAADGPGRAWHRRARFRRGDPLAARLRILRQAGPDRGDMPLYGGAVAPADAGLGYQRYGAHGGDFGAAVTTFMALDDPAPMLGIHLANLDLAPYTGPGSRPLSAAEQAYLAQYQRWREDDRGYGAVQSTRPQTLSYGLNDSPAGLAAWVLEKWRGWADSGGDIEATFSRDFLLTVVTLYWATQTIDPPCGTTWITGGWQPGLSLADAVTVPSRGSRLPPVHRRRHASPRVGRTPVRHPPVDTHAPRRPLPIRRAARPALAATSPPSSTTSALRPARNDALNGGYLKRFANRAW